MANINLSTHVAAPIEQVFEAFSNFEMADQTVDAIIRVKMLTDGPVGVGTKFEETRVMFGREATEEMEVTAFEPNKLYTVSADTCGARFDSTFHFKSDAAGTRVEMQLATRATTMMARLMWPIGKLMMGSMKKMMQTDMDNVKAVCERAQLAL